MMGHPERVIGIVAMALAIGPAPAPAQTIAAEDALVAAWDMTSLTADGQLRDAGPYGLHGTIARASLTAGPVGDARAFRTVADRVRLPADAAFDVDGPLTIAAWLRVDETGLHQHVLACDDKFALWVTPDDRFRLGDTHGGGWSTQPGAARRGEWTSVVAVLDARPGAPLTAESVALWVNGERTDSGLHLRTDAARETAGTWNSGALYPADACYIGFESHQGNEAHQSMPFVGAIDELQLYARAWTEQEVRGFSTPVRAAAAAEVVLPYATGDWDEATLGNHRVVVAVDEIAPAVRVHIPWRRRDPDPERKAVIVTDAEGRPIANVVRVEITREAGVLAFEPVAGAGIYHVYFLPWESAGRSNYPKVVYPEPRETADPAWVAASGLADGAWRDLPEARPLEIQSIDEFHSFWPMEVIATAAETDAVLARDADAAYFLFPEDRRYPVRMAHDLPWRWTQRGAGGAIAGEALRGEWYAFQVGVWAARQPIDDIEASFSALTLYAAGYPGGGTIPPSAASCVTTGGVDWTGAPLDRLVAVPRRGVQPLWCGVMIDEQTPPGDYIGRLTVAPAGLEATTLPIQITVRDEVIVAAGDDEPWRHSRLRWMNSAIALDDEVVAPYEPVQVSGQTVRVLGREIELGAAGFPSRIDSFFPIEMTSVGDEPRAVLAAPVALEVADTDGAVRLWEAEAYRVGNDAPGLATWETVSRSGDVEMRVRAGAEFDGTVEYTVQLSAARDTPVSDVRLRIPIARDVARYFMGMGQKGGLRPASLDWSWDVERNQDGAWIGDVNAGLQFSLRDERYVRPLNTNFYQLKPLVMPRSWNNGGAGGCRMAAAGDAFEVVCFSGARTLRAGDPLRFDFTLRITPFHPLDTDQQWRTRFFHRYRSLDEIQETGATVINVHHANEINPFINYPFMRPAEMKAYVDDAHTRGMKVKIYYTVRELSNIAPELFALLSLDQEVFSDGPGGGFSWLQEHVERGYIGGWFVPELEDAAIVTSGTSRWHNYYLEGLDWLARNVGIDGLYIDDVAFDRTVMKRVRKILDRNRPDALIDLHSANQYNPRDGFANSANLYLEHFPFIDRLWFGEYFDYDSPPDFWMTEVSGIPFGLMGEMLQDGGNPWRGMLWGMTNRLPWTEEADPRALWRAWDEFGMQGTRMIGFWVPHAPVRTGRDDVLATTYGGDGKALISIASWAESEVAVGLTIDWQALGLDPANATIRAHAIDGFQPQRDFTIGEPIPVAPGRGWLLTVLEQERGSLHGGS